MGLDAQQQREVERLMPMVSGMARKLRPKDDDLEAEAYCAASEAVLDWPGDTTLDAWVRGRVLAHLRRITNRRTYEFAVGELDRVPAPEIDLDELLDEGETMKADSDVVIPALMRVREVARFLALSRAKVWRLVAAAKAGGEWFPLPFKSGGCTRFKTSEVVEWVEKQEAA
jgi:predicted DNA-binding transcriptional regulator AlpA